MFPSQSESASDDLLPIIICCFICYCLTFWQIKGTLTKIRCVNDESSVISPKQHMQSCEQGCVMWFKRSSKCLIALFIFMNPMLFNFGVSFITTSLHIALNIDTLCVCNPPSDGGKVQILQWLDCVVNCLSVGVFIIWFSRWCFTSYLLLDNLNDLYSPPLSNVLFIITVLEGRNVFMIFIGTGCKKIILDQPKPVIVFL